MFLKKKLNPNWFTKALEEYSKSRVFFGFLLIIVFVIYSSFLVLAGGYLHRMGFYYKIIRPYVVETKSTLFNYYKSFFFEPNHISIDIKHKDYMKLEHTRHLAIQNGTLVGVSNEYVNAKIRHKDETIPIKLRLRGSMSKEHQEPDKWSMRIKVRGDAALFNMKKFSLMDLPRRDYMRQWFYREVIRKEGIVSKRYEFVDVSINGTWKGVYALDEHYDKTMLEYNHRKDGPIIHLEKDALFIEKPTHQLEATFAKLDIGVFDAKRIFAHKELYEQFKYAKNLLQAYRIGEMKTHEVFDIEKLARWVAISDIMCGWHGFAPSNMRFYYNPVTSKLEPVPDDTFNERDHTRKKRCFRLEDRGGETRIVNQMFSDLKFMEKYIKELERVSKKKYLDSLFKEFSKEIEKNLATIHSDRSMLWYAFPKQQLYEIQEQIRRRLNPHKAIQAFVEKKSPDSLVINIANNERIPVVILNATLHDKKILQLENKVISTLDGIKMGDHARFTKFRFSIPRNLNIDTKPHSNLKISYKLIGTSKVREAIVFPYPAYSKKHFKRGIPRAKTDFKNFSFLDIDEKKKLITFKKGNWKLEQDLLIPRGFNVKFNSGVILDMINSSKILSYSPLEVIGTEKSPIIFISSDETGQGISVLNVQEISIFKNVIFRNLSPPSNEHWKLTGSLNFYESPVHFYKCKFLSNKNGDDFLNIIRSKFVIDSSSFVQTFADALDVDFSTGEIMNTSFFNCGVLSKNGDGVDISGSSVRIKNLNFDNIMDKALSVGENSVLVGDKVFIKNSRIAVASKDMSNVKISNIKVDNSKIGFAVFQKKAEYGYSFLDLTDLKTNRVDDLFIVEKGSTLVHEGEKIIANRSNVRELLYGAELKKLN